MPTVLRIGAARFFFYSNERGESPHVHVEEADAVAKFWLEPVSLASTRGLRPRRLRELERIVVDHREAFLAAWNEHFRT
jgi:hypothetical protein